MLDTILFLSLWCIMFCIGSDLEPRDFVRVFRGRRALCVGVASLVLIIPVFDVIISCLFRPPPVILLGLVLLATTPGGVLSNVLTDLAKGNVALSVSLSIGVSMLYIIAIPFIVVATQAVLFRQETLVPLHAGDLLMHVVTITVVPILFGMLLGRRPPPFLLVVLGPLKLACTIVLLVAYAAVMFRQRGVLEIAFHDIAWAVLVMNCVNPLWAYCVCRMAKLTRPDSISVIFEHLIRQEGTAIFIAISLLHQEAAALPLIINSLFGIVIGLSLTGYFRSRGKIPLKQKA